MPVICRILASVALAASVAAPSRSTAAEYHAEGVRPSKKFNFLLGLTPEPPPEPPWNPGGPTSAVRRMRKWRRWSRLVLLAVAVALAGGATVGVRARWVRQVARAQAEIAAGRIGPARHRLAALATAHPGALGGTVDYLLGTCEAIAGRDEAALSAFARVPDGFEFASAGATSKPGPTSDAAGSGPPRLDSRRP